MILRSLPKTYIFQVPTLLRGLQSPHFIPKLLKRVRSIVYAIKSNEIFYWLSLKVSASRFLLIQWARYTFTLTAVNSRRIASGFVRIYSRMQVWLWPLG